MALLDHAASFLSEFQGGLAYHLSILIAASLLFAFAHAIYSRRGDIAAFHWALAAGLLTVARLGLIIVLGITALTGPESDAFLAPLERYLGLAGALALAWAFTSLLEDPLGDHIFAAAQALAMLGLFASMLTLALFNLPTSFNSSAQGIAWHAAGLVIVIAIELGLLLRRPSQWALAASGFGFLIAGLILQLIFGPASGSAAGYLRLGELAAYPVLALAASRELGSLVRVDLPSEVGTSMEIERDDSLANVHLKLRDLQQENERLLARLLDAETGPFKRPEAVRGPSVPPPGPEERPVKPAADRSGEALKGMEDSPEVAELKAEFKLALQELASLSHAPQAGTASKPAPIGEVGALTAVIHDMRQTLTSAASYADLLQGEMSPGVDQEQKAFLDRLKTDVQRLADQVEMLSSLTTERVSIPGPPEGQIDPARIIRTAVAQAKRNLKRGELTLATDLSDGLPFIAARPDDLLRLINLMIDNAVASSPRGEQIEFSARDQRSTSGSWLILTVTDAGVGFPPEELARVFTPGGETHPASPGLAEVKAAAGVLGGRVWVGSEPGAGVTTTVLLPAAASSTDLSA